jgi:hypothetical protein
MLNIFYIIWHQKGRTTSNKMAGEHRRRLGNIGVGAWKMTMDRDEWRIITGAVKAATPLYKKYVSDEFSLASQVSLLGN